MFTHCNMLLLKWSLAERFLCDRDTLQSCANRTAGRIIENNKNKNIF